MPPAGPVAWYPLRGAMLAGRYRLEEPLGCGGVADVYRAVDTALGRKVAVKVFRPGAGPDLADQRRFEQEGRTLASLQHGHLVTLYDAGFSDDRAYLVLQLVDGITLSDRLRNGPLPPAEVARIGVALADAIGYVHAHKVMHRDVKPSNVLLEEDGGVYLTDFGIARMVDAPAITTTGMLVGTAAYLSPEQVSGRGVQLASDVYALGLVLLEALTGERVYRGGVAEVAVARLTNPPQIPADFGPEWQALLTAMTALDPADRPRAQHVADELGWLAHGREAGAATQAMPPIIAAGAGAGLAGIGAGGGGAGSGPDEAGPDGSGPDGAGSDGAWPDGVGPDGPGAVEPFAPAGVVPVAAAQAGSAVDRTELAEVPEHGSTTAGPTPPPAAEPSTPGLSRSQRLALAAVAACIALLAGVAVALLTTRSPSGSDLQTPPDQVSQSPQPRSTTPAAERGGTGTGSGTGRTEGATQQAKTSTPAPSSSPSRNPVQPTPSGGATGTPTTSPTSEPSDTEGSPTTPTPTGTGDETGVDESGGPGGSAADQPGNQDKGNGNGEDDKNKGKGGGGST